MHQDRISGTADPRRVFVYGTLRRGQANDMGKIEFSMGQFF